MGDTVIDSWMQDAQSYTTPGLEGDVSVDCIDCVATLDSVTSTIAISCINKHETEAREITLSLPITGNVKMTSLIGNSANDYNDIGRNHVYPLSNPDGILERTSNTLRVMLPAHSVSVIRVGQ